MKTSSAHGVSVPAAGILRRAIGRRLAVGLVHLLGGGLLGRGLALGGCGDLGFFGKMVGLPMFTMINGCFTGKHGGFERKDGGVTGKNDDFLATFGDLSMTRKVV